MKNFALIILLFFCSTATFAKFPDPSDFFAGKWKITMVGIPTYGDLTLTTDLVRQDGSLTGSLNIVGDKYNEQIQISKIEDNKDKVTIFYTVEGFDVNLELTKVDSDNVKGSLMGMFEAKGTRLKE